MSRVLFLGMGIGLVVFSLLVLPLEAAEPAMVNHATDQAYDGVSPAGGQGLLAQASSVSTRGVTPVRASAGPTRTARNPSLVDRHRMETLLRPSESHTSVGNFPTGPEGGDVGYIEIEVSHSAHVFKLYASSLFGKKEVLYECRVGLGNPHEFPTPVGVYFVTHIYDDDPWWIPPTNRDWAAGQSPSKKVYGGTMAPLLKKRPVKMKAKKQALDPEDKIAEQVQLNDDGYRFHGTNAPRSIGQNQSHGCVRMLPDDARKVANLIKDHVGIAEERTSENGKYVILKSPVRLNLVK
ncbi:MAG: L,D-transpeptidase [Desulfomonilaceae bacterium]